MSDENVAIVRGMFERFAAGDYEAAMEVVHPEVVWEDPDLIPGRGTHRGREGVARWFSRWLGAWETFTVEPLELINAGDEVVAVERMRGRGLKSGIEVDQEVFATYLIQDGQVARRSNHASRSEALDAAGLSE